MNQYIFILGNNPELSVAEIQAVYPKIKIIEQSPVFLIGEIAKFDCQEAMRILGGTIKIASVISDGVDQEKIIASLKSTTGKVKFGFSFYDTKPTNIGMEIKRQLKDLGVSSRLVVSKDKALSAVIVKKEKVTDFIILPKAVGQTCAVQDFEAYGKRDYDRPKSDALSGMLPPKLARMMLNLTGAKLIATVLDPFCGSGTVLMEAMDLGYHNLIGSDISSKAIADSRDNTAWLQNELELDNLNLEIFPADSKILAEKIPENSIDAIATEPYLGPPMKGFESEEQILKIKKELEALYLATFKQFKKILKKNGAVVIVFPVWHFQKTFNLDIEQNISDLGFVRSDKNNLIYKREGQKVWRNIQIWNYSSSTKK